MFGRQTWIDVNLDYLTHNYEVLKAASSTSVFTVVKANAYGHGMVEVAHHFESLDTPFICVSSINEAVILSDAGIQKDILIFSYVSETDMKSCHRDHFVYTIASNTMIPALIALNARCHLEVNVGMNRMGIKDQEEVWDIMHHPQLRIEGLYTHFQSLHESATTQHQLRYFESIVAQKPEHIQWVHIGNAPIAYARDHDWILGARFGLGLYGYREDVESLKPVLSMYSKIAVSDSVYEGETVGYDYTFTAREDTIFGSIPIGYGDGFMYEQQQLPVHLNGHESRILGKICMDQTMIEMTDQDAIGDVVELIGPHRTIPMLVQATGVNAYLLLTGLRSRVHRNYVRD